MTRLDPPSRPRRVQSDAPRRSVASSSARPVSQTRNIRPSGARPSAPRAPRIGEPGRRQTFLSVASLLLVAVFAARLIDVQILSAAPLAEEALAQRLVTVDITPARADIKDRNGVVLATSVERYNIKVDQTQIVDWKRTEQGHVVAEGPRDAAKAWLAANPAAWEPWLDGVTTKDGGDAKAAVMSALN